MGAGSMPPAGLVAASNLKAFPDEVGVADYDALLSRADTDPAWSWTTIVQRLRLARCRHCAT